MMVEIASMSRHTTGWVSVYSLTAHAAKHCNRPIMNIG